MRDVCHPFCEGNDAEVRNFGMHGAGEISAFWFAAARRCADQRQSGGQEDGLVLLRMHGKVRGSKLAAGWGADSTSEDGIIYPDR